MNLSKKSPGAPREGESEAKIRKRRNTSLKNKIQDLLIRSFGRALKLVLENQFSDCLERIPEWCESLF
jgi:hypothetical protein